MFGKRSSLRSGKLAKRRRRLLYLKVAAVVFVATAAVAGSAYGLSRPEVRISDVSVSGTEVLTEDEVRNVAKENLVGRYVYLFPKDNTFIYPRKSIEAAALRAHKRIKSVRVEREGLKSVAIHVEERNPFALWCSPEREEQETASTTEESVVDIRSNCYFLDDGGFIFTEAPYFSGDIYFRYGGEISNEYPIGEQFLTKELFTQLSLFRNALKDVGVEAVALRATEQDYEIDLTIGGLLRIARDQDLTEALSNLRSVLDSTTFKEADLSTLEYIDLRFGNKVYYRFKK